MRVTINHNAWHVTWDLYHKWHHHHHQVDTGPQEICPHNKCPRLVKLLPLNYSIYKHKKKVISTWHKDFSFPDPPKIEDSTMANTPDAALNISTNTQTIFPLLLIYFDSWSNPPRDDGDSDIAAVLSFEPVTFKVAQLSFVGLTICSSSLNVYDNGIVSSIRTQCGDQLSMFL